MENRNGSAKVTGCSPLSRSAKPICSAARRSWHNTFSPSARAISAVVSLPASKIGKANRRTRWRKRLSLSLARELWREKPKQSSFFGFWIDIEQGHACFRQLQRSAGQSRNDIRKVRFVADEHQNF